MTTKTAAQKSCGPQLSDTDLPSHGWDVDRLGNYAKRQYQAILKNERTMAPYYWRLGLALNIARKSFNRGQWGKFLTFLCIDKTRSAKACSIYDAFDSADEVAEMSVEEAYEARRHGSQKQGATLADQPAVLSVKLNKALAKIEQVGQKALDASEQLKPEEKCELLKHIRQSIAHLQKMERELERQMSQDAAGTPVHPL